MDGFRASVLRTPGAAFGEAPLAARTLDAGMGIAVARRTVFRPEDQEDFGRVAERVPAGRLVDAGRRRPQPHPPPARPCLK